jgi:hypothetical protein
LDIRTKHTIAQDRLIVAEQRILDAERRKSASNIQLLAFEQKQLEKKLVSLYKNFNSTNIDRPLTTRGRSTSEIIFRNRRRTSSWTETSPIHRSQLSVSLHNSNQNLLSLPKIDDIQRRFSLYSDDDTLENPFFHVDMGSGGEEEENSKYNFKIIPPKRITIKKKIIPKVSNQHNKLLPPIVTIISPEEDIFFLTKENLF